jgi:hypothetical protein
MENWLIIQQHYSVQWSNSNWDMSKFLGKFSFIALKFNFHEFRKSSDLKDFLLTNFLKLEAFVKIQDRV